MGAGSTPQGAARPFGIGAVPRLAVGHAHHPHALTGCTVVLVPQGAVCGVDVRGAAPGTRETDLLAPHNLVQAVHAVVLSGGSAFGLEAASGVMRFLEERGVGLDVGVGVVPIVPAAVLFDLAVGDGRVRPDAAAGRLAAETAWRAWAGEDARDGAPTQAGDVPRPEEGARPQVAEEAARGAQAAGWETAGAGAEGNVGAGCGATVGKLAGPGRAVKSGLGTAARTLPDGTVVGALVAVNAVGEVRDPATGAVLAGPRADGGGYFDSVDLLVRQVHTPLTPGTSTTIAVVAADVRLTKAQAQKVAQMAHDGLARTIRPVHTMYDGDTVFALATGSAEVPVDVVGAVAAEVLAEAVVRAVRAARPAGGLPACTIV
ncbi:P1 family peptidase [Alicyclobacillus macrosporangiidus]|uniref:P1 family peptidase n=1 Tax=Alicyclobacillus macrosporangiidus TaxID=392015 RepID=UPI0006925DC8|nr:P1 family peptidase [Alicyclobacillus macrosporangiidus]